MLAILYSKKIQCNISLVNFIDLTRHSGHLELELHARPNFKPLKLKKYHNIDNFVFNKCANFQIKICYTLGSTKKNKIINRKLNFIFLLSPKYNVFCSENLQDDRVQH
jgi:hypothetical protein